MMIELTPEVNRAFSAGDLGLLKSWGAAPGCHGESVLWRTANECAPNGALHRLELLLIDVQSHHGMNFPNCVFLCFRSSV